MQASSIPSKHLGYLDGWRAVAATWVLMHHAWYMVQDHLVGFPAKIFGFFFFGRVAVDLFIVLSGFCLMLPVIKGGGVLRGGIIEFIKRRAWRILPPYYCAMAFSLLLIVLLIHRATGTIWDSSMPVTPRSILTHVLLVHDASEKDFYTINYVFWSIAVEWRIYFFFPLLVIGWRYLGPLVTTLLAFIAAGILCVVSNRLLGVTLTFYYLGLFTAGMLGASISFASSDFLLRLQKLPWSWITLFLAFVVVGIYNVPAIKNAPSDCAVGLLSTSALIMTSINRSSWLHRILSFGPISFVGTFAYSIYLIHAPLLQVLWQYIFAPLQPHPLAMLFTLWIVGVPAIIGSAYLFFLCFERPFLIKRKAA